MVFISPLIQGVVVNSSIHLSNFDNRPKFIFWAFISGRIPERHPTPVCGHRGRVDETIGPAVRADFRRLYPANAKTPTCCPSDDNRTKVTNSVTSARSLWWHVGPCFWPADLTRDGEPHLQIALLLCLGLH